MTMQQHRASTRRFGALAAALMLAVTPAANTQTTPGQVASGPADSQPATPPGPAPADDGSPTVDVSDDGIVEMHIQGGDLFLVLQKLLLKSRRNIVFGRNVSGQVTVSLYNVTLEEALSSILRQNGYGYREEGNFIYIYTLEELAHLKAAEQERNPGQRITKSFRLSYVTPSDAQTLLKPFLSADGEIITTPAAAAGGAGGSGGGSGGSAGSGGGRSSSGRGQAFALDDMIIVRDYDDYMQQIEAGLAQIDRRPKQVLVEATIMSVTLDDSNSMGIDFNIVGGVDFERVNHSSTLTNAPNGTTSGTGTGGTGGTGGIGGATAGAQGSDFQNLTNAVPVSMLDDFSSGASTEFAGAVPAGGLSIGFVTDQVTAFVRALEQVSDVSILANPKVLVLNKQPANILVGSRLGYLTTNTTETSTQQVVEFLETGTQLVFTPYIGNDGFVRMEIMPQDSNGRVVGGLPQENTTEVATNVLIKDGHTIFIGGLFREFTSTSRSQIPLLGSIPLIGEAFASNADNSIREEVVILLSVHIIDDENYAAHSAELYEDVERARVGARSGLQAHGRERLAQANYQAALKYAAAGHDELALWHVDLALHNQSAFIDAIRLKEELLQRRNWAVDGSSTRTFLQDLVREKAGLPPERFGRPLLQPMPVLPAESQPYDLDPSGGEHTAQAEPPLEKTGSGQGEQ